jgi:hypothetical protein
MHNTRHRQISSDTEELIHQPQMNLKMDIKTLFFFSFLSSNPGVKHNL